MKSCWIVSDQHSCKLEYKDVPMPEPKEGEVVIKTHASSLNRGELIVGSVVHGGPLKLGGGDGAGVVHKLGPGVTNFKVGDAVYGRISGGWAEYTPCARRATDAQTGAHELGAGSLGGCGVSHRL